LRNFNKTEYDNILFSTFQSNFKQSDFKQSDFKQSEPKQSDFKQSDFKQSEPKQSDFKQSEPKQSEPKQSEPNQKEIIVKRGNNNNNNNNNNTSKVFELRPDIQNDIYYLYCYDNNVNKELVKYDIALIPDFKTSVILNSIFRNIKENTNLDLLEESDTEEEFEDNNINKYVNLDKKIKMKCNFNYKFKKWVPNKVVDENIELTCLENLTNK
jgi:hypothetical protein